MTVRRTLRARSSAAALGLAAVVSVAGCELLPLPEPPITPLAIDCELPGRHRNEALTCDEASEALRTFVEERQDRSLMERATIRYLPCDDTRDCAYADDQGGLVEVVLRDGERIGLHVIGQNDGQAHVVPLRP